MLKKKFFFVWSAPETITSIVRLISFVARFVAVSEKETLFPAHLLVSVRVDIIEMMDYSQMTASEIDNLLCESERSAISYRIPLT